MTMQTLPSIATPTPEDTRIAKETCRKLSKVSKKKNLSISLTDSKEVIELPAIAVDFLLYLLGAMADGNPVQLIPHHAELTTQKASEMLGVSRPFLIKQLEDGAIPYRKVGTHRRILFSDLMRFKQSMFENREHALDELSAISQDLGLDDNA